MKILIGGSPCTHWSIAQTKNRETEASGIGWDLFLNYRIARDKYQPDYFLYENNKSMAAAIREQITAELGVEPVLINSALVSAQNRQRLYWAGKRNPDGTYSQVDVEQPADRGILLRDILETGVCRHEKGYTLKPTSDMKPLTEKEMDYVYDSDGKAVTLTARPNGGGVDGPLYAVPAPAAMRQVGRRINEQGHRDDYNENLEYIQRFEINEDPQKTNCLTTVQKDNMVAVPAVSLEDQGILSDEYYHGGFDGPLIGMVETPMTARNGKQPSQHCRVYSCDDKYPCIGTDSRNRAIVPTPADGKGVTLCGNGGGLGAKTGLYAVPIGCDVIITENSIRCQRKDKKHSTVQGSHVTLPTGKTQVMSPSHVPMVIEAADGKQLLVHEVRNGQITIKGKEYPIKLRDGCYIIRKLTVTECKRLQTVPDEYIFPTSDSQAYKMLGNGWTVDAIAHIMSHFEGLTTEPVEVLSMYDGMSCGHIALDKLGAEVSAYYATEIDKYAIQTTQHNFPETVQLGDAFQVRDEGWRPWEKEKTE